MESELKKAKANLAAKMNKWEISDNLIAKSLIKVDAAKAKMSVALQELVELQKVTSAPMYQWVFERDFYRAGNYYTRYMAKLPP